MVNRGLDERRFTKAKPTEWDTSCIAVRAGGLALLVPLLNIRRLKFFRLSEQEIVQGESARAIGNQKEVDKTKRPFRHRSEQANNHEGSEK